MFEFQELPPKLGKYFQYLSIPSPQIFVVVVADRDIIQGYENNFFFFMVEVFYGSKSQKQKKLTDSVQSPAIPAPAANSCNQKIVNFHSIPLWGRF